MLTVSDQLSPPHARKSTFLLYCSTYRILRRAITSSRGLQMQALQRFSILGHNPPIAFPFSLSYLPLLYRSFVIALYGEYVSQCSRDFCNNPISRTLSVRSLSHYIVSMSSPNILATFTTVPPSPSPPVPRKRHPLVSQRPFVRTRTSFLPRIRSSPHYMVSTSPNVLAIFITTPSVEHPLRPFLFIKTHNHPLGEYRPPRSSPSQPTL